MERLSETVKDIVGDIDNVVDAAHADGLQALFEPVGALFHLHSAYGHSAVAGSALLVEHLHLHGAVGAVGGECICRRIVQVGMVEMAVEVCGQIACHTVVACGVDAVGGEVHLHHPVAFEVEIFSGGGTGLRCALFRDDDDAVVGGAHSDLVLGAYHAERFHTAYFGFLYLERFFSAVESGAHGGYHYSLSCGHVGRAAYYLGRLSVAEVYGGHMQVVTVGVLHTSEHLSDHETLEASFYRFHFLEAVGFKTYGSECLAYLCGRKVEVEVFL